ncbi:MAG: peptidylprolyl isomerase, partial [Fimbriimonadales bacterium]
MRFSLVLLLSLAILGSGASQLNRAQQADTTIKVAVEGRGTISIKLFTKDAPKACSHILDLVRQGFYEGQRFFRVTRSP